MRNLILILLCLSFLIGCELENPEDGVFTGDIITLSVNSNELLANGEDRITITANLGPQADANQTIRFETEDGRFAGAGSETPTFYEINASSKEAIVTLVGSNLAQEEVIVSAEVAGFITREIITFERAFPDRMILRADRPVVIADRTDFANLTVDLFRDIGVPSTETRVDFEVVQLDTAAAELVPFAFSNNAIATAMLKSATTDPGNVLVIAKTEDGNGGEIRDTVEINFQ